MTLTSEQNAAIDALPPDEAARVREALAFIATPLRGAG